MPHRVNITFLLSERREQLPPPRRFWDDTEREKGVPLRCVGGEGQTAASKQRERQQLIIAFPSELIAVTAGIAIIGRTHNYTTTTTTTTILIIVSTTTTTAATTTTGSVQFHLQGGRVICVYCPSPPHIFWDVFSYNYFTHI